MADPRNERNASFQQSGADLIDDEWPAFHFFAHGVEGRFRLAIFHQIDGPEETKPADFSDARMLS